MHPFEFLQRYGRTALVSEASTDLGEAFACELAKGGFDLVLPVAPGDSLSQLAARLEDHEGVHVSLIAGDPASPRYAEQLMDACAGRDIGLLVVCLSVNPPAAGQTGSRQTGSRQTGSRQTGSILSSLTRVFSPSLRQRSSSGMIIADESGVARGLGESLWRELHPVGIDVLTLCADPVWRDPVWRDPVWRDPSDTTSSGTAMPRTLAKAAMERITLGPVFDYTAQSWGEPE